MGDRVRLCFVAAVGGSAFMFELLEVVADAVANLGVATSMHLGPFPAVTEPSAFVVIPHEYFVLTPPADLPSDGQRARTVGFCVEHPGKATFEVTARHAATLGAVVDINRSSTAELRRRGISAERFQLGYSHRWDAGGGDLTTTRPIDIVYMGTTDGRRDSLLARQADVLWEWECRLLIPPHEMMTTPRPDFLMGRDKFDLLARTSVLLNLHRGESRSLEWVRVLEAMCNGCVVVSERSTDFEPLVQGEHLLFAAPGRTAAVAAALLRNPDRLESLRRGADAMCRSLDMHGSCVRLLEIAQGLVSGPHCAPGPAGTHDRDRRWVPVQTAPFEPPPPPSGMPALTGWAAAMPPRVRTLVAASREILAAGAAPPLVRLLPGPPGPTRVAALIPVIEDRTAAVDDTLRSLRDQDDVVVDIMLASNAAASASDGSAEQPGRRGLLLNTLLQRSTAELLLLVEAGQVLFPAAARRLVDGLTGQPTTLAYGLMADPGDLILFNALPWEPERLDRRVYLCPPFLIRRADLLDIGGFSEDLVLEGYEYHDLLCRLADRGHTATFVQQILGRGRPVRAPELSAARLTPELVVARLADRRAAGDAASPSV